MDLTGKLALITGAASGMGAATSRLLAELGATVIGADVADDAGQQLFGELGAPHRYVHLDVTDPDAWKTLAEGLGREHGGLDVAFLNAGIMTRPVEVPILDDPLVWLDAARYRRVMSVNTDGVVFGLAALVPQLEARGGGDVVITGSGAAVQPFEPDPIYSASKYALVGLARSFTPWLDARGIRINVLCPNSVATNIVPVDLRELPGKVFSPPAYIAESVVRVLESEQTGGVWLARGTDQPAFRAELPDLNPKQSYIEVPAP